MPEMESLREGVTEVDYKTYTDKFKPYIDRVTSTPFAAVLQCSCAR